MPTEQRVGWASEPVWTFYRREKSLTSGGNRTPDTPAHNIVTISRQYVMAVSEILLSEFQNKKCTLPALMSSVCQIQAKYASPMGKNAAVTRRANYAIRQTLQRLSSDVDKSNEDNNNINKLNQCRRVRYSVVNFQHSPRSTAHSTCF